LSGNLCKAHEGESFWKSVLRATAQRSALVFSARNSSRILGGHPWKTKSLTMSTDSASSVEVDIAKQREEARWNRLADGMRRFHNYFKMEFDNIYKLADGSFNEHHMSLPMFLREIDGLHKHLTAHHTIEERYIFPDLAKRMPAFSQNEKHLKSHEGIHEGLDRLSLLTTAYRKDPTSYSPEKIRECLDSFRDVLMTHLDEEVEDLSAENMKKYWTLAELERIAF